MRRGYPNVNRVVAVAAGLGLTVACASAQEPQAAGPKLLRNPNPGAIPLVSDVCPAVTPGGRVSLDWNPGFDHSGVVLGIGNFGLRFGRLASNGVTVQQVASLTLRELSSAQKFTAIGNGYYHIELTVPVKAAPGEYHVVDANAIALTHPDYQGPPLWMTNSPVAARYCFTVVLPPRTTPASAVASAH